MKWINANDRLPSTNGDIIWRYIGLNNYVKVNYKKEFGFISNTGGILPFFDGEITKYGDHMYGHKNYEKIQWLDEH